jgi:putative acetyltransferase
MGADDIEIRPYRAGDEDGIVRVFFDSVRHVGVRHYSAAQVEAWAPAPPDLGIVLARVGDGRLTLVAVDADGAVVGYGDLEPDGHIDHLYCAPEAVAIGLGSRIVAALLEAAERQGITHLFVEASDAARPVFERHGFVVDRRNDLVRHGVALHNWSMTRPAAASR